ncbi:siderophore-interacting protein [Amycolatopsis acidicola]|uniref:Siderophore-interacting protein n=1 Tax=Amycolatopsis acidicola TaxID=2596893 RepID=A0A5N0V0I0_9PSEU|nr:siderophore-interacting protein [Amycolatopsis acidicola]KAA9159072.1 siderophore-interacting protein [Amycolatopsis acidicola]
MKDSIVDRRGGPRRPRRPPEPVEVVRLARITPRLVSVHVGGADLSRFQAAAPTSHIKLFLPAPGQDAPTLPKITAEGRTWPEDKPRPIVRTYTPRYFDAYAGTLEVQFVLHGDGPAATWAQRAKAGDKLAIGGPGGRLPFDLTAPEWWIGGDESALPAVGTLLDALPASAKAAVHLEVDGAEDEIPLDSAAQTTVTWHHRRHPEAWGEELYDAAAGAVIDAETQVWVACEASAVRRIRRQLLDRQVPRSSLVTRGYWRQGVADHPDHDHGED